MNTGPNAIPAVRNHLIPLTLNLIVVGLFSVFAGIVVSYGVSRFVPAFNYEWERQSALYRFTDICLEVSALTLVAFWFTYVIRLFVPIFKVGPGLEGYIESFGIQMLFLYTLFLFIGGLDEKLKFSTANLFTSSK